MSLHPYSRQGVLDCAKDAQQPCFCSLLIKVFCYPAPVVPLLLLLSGVLFRHGDPAGCSLHRLLRHWLPGQDPQQVTVISDARMHNLVLLCMLVWNICRRTLGFRVCMLCLHL